jgi:peptidoglycan hydrolase CwlO-like protein|tara:strand:- start:854 stop:1045 length:192 start_codon:yes stop_codon:yes gene_type:complete
MNLDIKTLIILGGIAVTFGGFYYGTQLRLDHLEEAVQSVQKESDSLKKQVQRLSKKVNKRNSP